MTETQTPADPSAYRVKIARNAHGVADGITILDAGGGVLLDSEDDVFARLIAKAREEDGADPHDDKLPSDRAFILAALRDLGIPIQGEDDEDDGAASEARIQNAMAFGLEPPEEPPHLDPQDEALTDKDAPTWHDVALCVSVNDTDHYETCAGEFCDDNQFRPGSADRSRIRDLAKGEVDEVRLGGGAAPLVVLTRRDAPAQPMENALLPTRPDPLPALLEAAKAAEAFMSGFEDDELQDPPITDRLARLRAAIAAAEGR
jgi:hypothetical protein